MISIKTAVLAGVAVIGLAGITAYASGTFCTAETTQAQPVQAVFTSGGDACCAEDKATTKTTAQNAVFTPKVQTAALAGDTCPYDAKQKAALTTQGASCEAKATMTTASMAKNGQSCDAKATATTTSLASNSQSCCATDGNKTTTSKTNLAAVVPTATTN